MIVSDVAGTTRDAIDLPLEVDGRKLVIVDTAGLRRQAKVSDSVEYYTTLRSQRAVERADVALVVCDAHDGVTTQDLRIAELAMQEGCATALVLNKWDVAAMDEADLDHERARVAQKLRLRPKVLTASALTGRNVERVLDEAIALGDRMRNRIPTPQLNRFLSEVVAGAPAAGQAGPPAQAALHDAVRDARRRASRSRSTRRNRVTRDYAYFIENRLRAPLRHGRRAARSSTSTSASSAAASVREPIRGDAATLRRTHDQLSDNEYLFTSESVTEGHPDKIADQISDGVLDAVLRDDPYGRVACETLVNTGLVVVSGEISTDDLRRHPGRSCARRSARSATPTPTSASAPTPARSSTRSTSSRPTSPRASTRPTRRAPTPPTTTRSTSPARATRA